MASKALFEDLGAAADELNYGIVKISNDSIELVASQSNVRITIETFPMNGDVLRKHLVPIPHKSGLGYTRYWRDEKIG